MRLAVRLSKETKDIIELLKMEIKSTGKFDNIQLTNGFVLNQAYLDCKKITAEENWHIVMRFESQTNERNSPKTRTDLQVNQATFDGISKLKKILIQYGDTNYVTTSFVIRMVVKGSLLLRHGKL